MGFGDILTGFAQAGHEHQTNLIQMAYKQRDQLADAYSRLMQDDKYPEEARTQFGQAFQDITTSDPFKLPQVIKKYKDMQISVTPPSKPPVSLPAQEGDTGPTAGIMHAGQAELPQAGIDQRLAMMPQRPPEMRSIFAPMSFEEQMSRYATQEKIKGQNALDIAKAKAGEWKRETDYARDMPDGKRHKFVSETRVNPETGGSERRDVDLGEIANFAPRQGDIITLAEAKLNRDKGYFEFKDINGNDLDLDAMLKDSPFGQIRSKGNYYQPLTPKMEFKTFNNQVNAVNPLAPTAPTGAAATGVPGQPGVMGTATMPKTAERPMRMPDETGGFGIAKPSATTTVQTGPLGAPAPVAPGGLPAGPAGLAPMPAPPPQVAPPAAAKPPVASLSTTAPTPPATAKTAPPPQDGLTGKLPVPKGAKPIPMQKVEGSMNPTEFNRQSKIVTAIHPALNVLMGDPDNPAFRGMDAFADFADNAESMARLGTAARLIIHEMADTKEGGAGLGASILGSGVSLGGGLFKALENKFGLTKWKASTSGKVIDDATKDLSPDERQFLDRMIGAYGTVVGLRAVSQNSALQFSTSLMEKELPIPGLSGVVSKRQFYDKLATLAGEPIGSTKTFRPSIFVDRDYYMKKNAVFTSRGNGWREAKDKQGNSIFQHEDGKMYDPFGRPIQ